MKLFIADDHEVWRGGLRHEVKGTFDVIGEAASAPEAVAGIKATTPDVVACDLHMPGGGGITVVRMCADVSRIVIVSVSEAERDVLDCVAAGAVGYLVKNASGDDLRRGLRAAADGEAVFSPGLAGLVLAEFRRMGHAISAGSALTDREREVLVLVARGHSYREIGDELFISRKTAENHVRNILAKLHLSGRDQLMRYALDHGLDGPRPGEPPTNK